MRIAFYAPLKSPHHPVPSGDRTIARLFMAAMERAGHEVELASELRTWAATPEPAKRTDLLDRSQIESDDLLARWLSAPDKAPELWLTYHPYYKAPDWIGPQIARTLAIPYVTAEASYAPKRDRDDWAPWQGDVVNALRLASLNICMTPVDQEAMTGLLGTGKIASLNPFIDTEAAAAATLPAFPPEFSAHKPLLVTVAMMRPGDKLKSYRMLAGVLGDLEGLPWSLAIVGDGGERAAVEEAFRAFPRHRVAFCGQATPQAVAGYLSAGDIYVWPGFGEAYGLAFLEAQLAGLPVVAQRAGGIASVVEHGRTGILTSPDDRDAFRDALAMLIGDAAQRKAFGAAAGDFVRHERALAPAAVRLSAMLLAVVDRWRKDMHAQ